MPATSSRRFLKSFFQTIVQLSWKRSNVIKWSTKRNTTNKVRKHIFKRYIPAIYIYIYIYIYKATKGANVEIFWHYSTFTSEQWSGTEGNKIYRAYDKNMAPFFWFGFGKVLDFTGLTFPSWRTLRPNNISRLIAP